MADLITDRIVTLRRQLRDAQQAEAAGRIREIDLTNKMLAYQGLAKQAIVLSREVYGMSKPHLTIAELGTLGDRIGELLSLLANIRKEHGD